MLYDSFVDVSKEYEKYEELKKEDIQFLQKWVDRQPHLPEISAKMVNFADVENEYEKNEELKKEDIQSLQKWVTKQPHLPKISELDLILFLHCSYYQMDSAKKYIETFYSIRARWPEVFKNRNPSINTKVLETMLFTPLPKPTPLGYQVFYCKLIDCNPGKFFLDEHIKSFDMAMTLMLHQEGTTPGQIIFVDAAGISFRHVLKFSFTSVRRFLHYLQEALPVRLKKFIIINTPLSMHKFLMLIRPFFSKELANNFQTYTSDFDEVYQLIPMKHLPSEYGGESDSITELTRKRNEVLLANENFFVEDEQCIADESERMCK